MKKDYICVEKIEKDLTEIDYLNRFWTRHWHKQKINNSTNYILQDEKYLHIRPYLATLGIGSRILDGGCGLGEWSVFLAQKNFNVVGLDISWQVLTKKSKQGLSSICFVSGDIRRIPFKDNSFDLYVSWGAFEHFEEGMADCLREGFRLLKRGGLLCLTVPYQNWRHILRDSQQLYRWDENYILGRGYSRPMRFYQWRLRPQELRREVLLHGFQILKIVPINKGHGIFRFMHHEFNWLKPDTVAYRFFYRMLNLLLPRSFVAHMLIAIAKRP